MTTSLIVFAKVPRPGSVKTRLIPSLGPDKAARLAEIMLSHTLDRVSDLQNECADWRVILAVSEVNHPFWQRLQLPCAIRLIDQGAGNLGERMMRAAERELTFSERVILVGTDCPALTGGMIVSADAELGGHDVVIVPATDGGYVLIGLNGHYPVLFEGIAWGGMQVLTGTRSRARAHRLSVAELPALPDVDEEADLVHLPADWRPQLGLED